MMSRKLPEVCEIQYGFPFDSSLFSAEGDLPLIRIRDVVRGYTETYTSEKCDVAYLVHEGDILVGMDGVFNVAKWKGEPAYLNQRVCRIIPNETIDADFLFYFIPTALKKIENETAFVTVKHLKAKQLNAVVVPDVPIEEQKKIAAQLNVITDLIFLRQRQAEKLDELVKARFVEMFGVAYSEVIAEDVCERIVDCPHSTPKYDESELKYPAIRTSEIQDGQIEWSSMKYVGVNEYERRVKRLIPEAGDIVYAREGTYGDCVILPEGHHFCLGQRTMLFRPNYTLCNSEYLHAVLRSAAVKYQADMSNAGSTVPHVNVSDAKRFHFPLPPLSLQNAFATFVHEVDREKERIQRSAALLETLKRSLMQQYFG